MPLDELGATFAPTADNAMDATRRGSIEGIPEAIRILSLRLPRFLGARSLAPPDLLNAQGHGPDLLPTLIRTLMPQAQPEPQEPSPWSPWTPSIDGNRPPAPTPRVIPGVGGGSGIPNLEVNPDPAPEAAPLPTPDMELPNPRGRKPWQGRPRPLPAAPPRTEVY